MIGKFIISNNLSRDIGPYLGPYQIISLNTEDQQAIPNVICGSILLPPYSIMTKIVGTEEEYPILMVTEEYLSYLHTIEPMAFIVGMIALLFKGISVILYANDFINEFAIIPQTINRFLNLRYGMVPEPNGNCLMFLPDPMYSDQIYSDLFLYDYCDLETLKRFHSSHPFNNEVSNKIIMSHQLNQGISGIDKVVDPFIVLRGTK